MPNKSRQHRSRCVTLVSTITWEVTAECQYKKYRKDPADLQDVFYNIYMLAQLSIEGVNTFCDCFIVLLYEHL